MDKLLPGDLVFIASQSKYYNNNYVGKIGRIRECVGKGLYFSVDLHIDKYAAILIFSANQLVKIDN